MKIFVWRILIIKIQSNFEMQMINLKIIFIEMHSKHTFDFIKLILLCFNIYIFSSLFSSLFSSIFSSFFGYFKFIDSMDIFIIIKHKNFFLQFHSWISKYINLPWKVVFWISNVKKHNEWLYILLLIIVSHSDTRWCVTSLANLMSKNGTFMYHLISWE